MILSFGWTHEFLPPIGRKDTTRRLWKESYLMSWQRAYDTDPLRWHDAVDKQLSYGGKYIGRLRLLERPFRQYLADMPPEDVLREGGMVNSVDEFIAKYFQGDRGLCPAVIRFEYKALVAPKPIQLNLLELVA